MSKKPQENTDADFSARRQRAREEVNKLDRNSVHTEPERNKFFNTVYDRANDDAAQIPWADLAPKPQLANCCLINRARIKVLSILLVD